MSLNKKDLGDYSRRHRTIEQEQTTVASLPNLARQTLTEQTRTAIIQSVLRNDFSEGQLPSENELAQRMGVSRTTIRAALRSVEDAGMIRRTRGRGTVVRAHAGASTLALQRLVSFTTLLRENGLAPVVHSHWELVDSPELQDFGGVHLEVDEAWYVINRVITADGNPAVWVVHYVPASYIDTDALGPENREEDWFGIAESYGAEPVDHVLVDLRANLASVEAARVLNIPPGTPLVVLYEVHYSESDYPLGYSRILANDKYINYSVIRQ